MLGIGKVPQNRKKTNTAVAL